ncbi:hypothetical protein P3S67_028275 [Capsicum chacoense]
MYSRQKVNPTIINNDARGSLYMLDVDADDFRSVLRINIVDRSFEGSMNSSPSPPRCLIVDDNLNDYESGENHPMNMEDDCVHMEDVSSDSQDAEEDCGMGSQPDCVQGVALPRKLLDVLERKYNCKEHYLWDTGARICLVADFFHMVELLNPGSSYSIMVNQIDGSFIYYFLAFGACIRGYAHMRKVIAVDGTHLYGKYGGVLLSVVTQETKNHIFPIAFCVIDKENDASWTFFFQNLKSIVEDEPDLYVISERHISIANAFSRVYSRAHHGLYMRHLAENLCVNQYCREHLYLFYAAVKAYSFDEFSENFEELKYNFPEKAYVLENVLGFEKWSRAHFLGNRYDVMNANIAESLNSILMDEREYPVSYIFNSIAKKFGKKFRERYAYVDGKENIFIPCAEKILRDNKSASDSLYVTNPNRVLDQYTVFGNGVTAKVNLLERSCFFSEI